METKIISNGVIRQNDLRPLCDKILEREVRPMHYADLTKEAIKAAGLHNGYNVDKIKEDVREKILVAGLDDSGYVGTPYCLAFKRSWVKRNQAKFNFDEPITVPVTVSSSTAGACETVFRYRYMLQKNTMEFERIDEASEGNVQFRMRRLIIEHNVSDYFKKRWPKLWLPASNNKKYKTSAPDDFRIKVEGSKLNIDVCTPDKEGKVGKVNMKKEAWVHVVAENPQDELNIVGFIPGKMFKGSRWSIGELYPINQLIFYLNCVDAGIPYSIFKKLS